MKRTAIFFLVLLASSLFAERAPVVKPRAKAHDYPAVNEQQSFTLGAEQLSAHQVRKAFVSNIGRNYVVVEVGMYPKSDTKILPRNFVLRATDEKNPIHPADPQLMASSINDKDQKGHDVDVYPVAGIGYSSGPNPDDPYCGTGRRRNGGVTATSGVMVEMKNRQKDPKTSDADRKAMTAELSEKSLPETAGTKAVVGYLYFPTSVVRGTHYQLEYQTPDGTVVVPLPTPAE
jgi:hypothetical protein